MAADNKTLGMFRLDGIAPAPRGIPQIEVTFDIDANGIVNVSAKDLGTGKEQKVTITSSTNMSKEDVEKAVKEAEQYASEDKKRREAIDVKNNADQTVYQTEKTITDLGDKIKADEKSDLETKLNALKEANKGDNTDDIKAKMEDLQKKLYEISTRIYQETAAQQQAQPGADAGNANSDYVDAEYKDVDDNN